MKQAIIKLTPIQSSFLQRIRYSFRKTKYVVQIPEQLSELSDSSFLFLMNLKSQDSISSADKMIYALVVLQIPRDVFLRIKEIDFVEKLLPQLNWAFTAPVLHPVIRDFEIGQVKLAMPPAELRAVWLRDFVACDLAFEKALVAESRDDINAFLASVLRPYWGKAEEERKPYSTRLVAKNKQFVNKLSYGKVMYVLTFWNDCRHNLKVLYPEAFEGAAESNEKMDWDHVMTDVAETGVFGSLKDVKTLDVHTFYKWLAKKSKQKKEQAKKAFLEEMKAQHTQR